jgi:hypothetical protein
MKELYCGFSKFLNQKVVKEFPHVRDFDGLTKSMGLIDCDLERKL